MSASRQVTGEPELPRTPAAVDDLQRSISAKLAANAPLLAKSLSWGHLSWRRDKSGQFTIDLDLRL